MVPTITRAIAQQLLGQSKKTVLDRIARTIARAIAPKTPSQQRVLLRHVIECGTQLALTVLGRSNPAPNN